MNKNLLTILDFTRDEIYELLNRAVTLKKFHKENITHQPLAAKTLGMIFEKSSTRTRVSFEVGAFQLGGNSVFLSPRDTQIGRGEPISDTARILSSYVDAILIRTFSQSVIEEFAFYATVPVINGLSDLLHPCQVLSDIFTVKEKKDNLEDLKIAWVGDGNNMSNSWINAALRIGFELVVACPASHRPDKGIMAEVEKAGNKRIQIIDDPREAAEDADVINTDVWTSMGQEDESKVRGNIFQDYQVNSELLSMARPDAIVMHCLPAHRGEEITEEVMEGAQSVIFEQAANRLHLQKAILEKLM